ncbi:hypothetical protein TVAG_481250 [Trichomonas vaginalis G3]|uniref:Uncharacterized protein n=1 Tax=Trichomonas vaginalis (strain ATCC PRA-98 / G3) TaxID=412133 RepID=A2F200_TRIV3|nr:hypothetical protein TVAGG3_0477480 [Trichomonas vaginalis G3]EAY01055.1 hypothetical protein TVAG_481250 [Trichomonas vaginalis G3]KAI5515506.1 hypothetical protein TVAGG3_0477480 [Trichomonas vaginalis G3]|eukprot:XP_001313927.1 hypothetical protein [Trichomonas vaginalis G3]
MDYETTKRKIREGMESSINSANGALATGLEALNRLKLQGQHLTNANDNLNPLLTSGEASMNLTHGILNNLGEARNMFIICAIVFIVLIFFVIRWKHS